MGGFGGRLRREGGLDRFDLGDSLAGRVRWRRVPLLWYFVFGATLIVAAKLAVPGLTGAIIAAVIAILAVVLKCLQHWGERGRRASWASDEAYYLGLLYTLVSLILAIVQLFILGASDTGLENLRSRTNDLIGNFGIGLMSTVAGILGRILLQARSVSETLTTGEPIRGVDEPQAVPLPDGESSTEIDWETPLALGLREQLQALRRNLFEASDGFAHFTRVTLEHADGTRASAEQVIAGFNERLADLAKAEIRGIAASWADAIAAMRTEHEAAVDEAKGELLGLRQRWTGLGNQVQTELERLTERFDKAAMQALQRTEAGWSELASSLAKSAETTRTSSEAHTAELKALLTSISGVRQQLEPLGAALANAREAIAAFQDTARKSTTDTGGLGKSLQETQRTLLTLNDTAKRLDADFISQVAEMANAHRALAEGCTTLIADVDALCRTALESNGDRVGEATEALGKAVKQADLLKAQIYGMSGMLDAQRDSAEHESANSRSMPEEMLRTSDKGAQLHKSGNQNTRTHGGELVDHGSRSQQGIDSPSETQSKPWWRFSRGSDPS